MARLAVPVVALGPTLFIACGAPPNPDQKPPSLVQASVSSSRAGAGDTLQVRIKASEELSVEPTVTLELAAPRSLSPHDIATPLFDYLYRVAGDETEGEVWLRAALTDLAGNRASVGIGTVYFDFTAPVFDSLHFGDTRHLKAGRTGVISLLVDDLLGTDSVATFVNSGALDGTELEYQPTAGTLPAFTYHATGDEPAGQSEIQLELVDVAGNRANTGPVAGFVFDFTAPVLEGEAVIGDPQVSLGNKDNIEVQFSASEELASARVLMRETASQTTAELHVDLHHVVLDNGGTPLITTEVTARRLAGDHTPFSTGIWVLEATLRDLAGNRAAGLNLGNIELID